MAWHRWSGQSFANHWWNGFSDHGGWDRGHDHHGWGWGKPGGSRWDWHSRCDRDGNGDDGTDGASYLRLSIPAGDHDADGTNQAARLMQDVSQPHADFEIEAKFLSEPAKAFQFQGLLVEGDEQNWLRFDVYHDGSKVHIFGAKSIDGDWEAAFDHVLSGADDAAYLKVTRDGDVWTFEYSSDGTTWSTAGSYTQEFSVASAGVLAGTTANPGIGPAFTVEVDYFEGTPGIIQSDTFDDPSLQGFWSLEGPAGTADVVTDGAEVAGDAPEGNLCALFSQAEELQFRYDPDNDVDTAQGHRKAGAWGTPDHDGSSYVVVANCDDVSARDVARGRDVYFADTVTPGDVFDFATDGHGKASASNLFVLVYDDEAAFRGGDDPLQTMKYDVSGWQPMELGDEIGSVTLVGYVGDDGGFFS